MLLIMLIVRGPIDLTAVEANGNWSRLKLNSLKISKKEYTDEPLVKIRASTLPRLNELTNSFQICPGTAVLVEYMNSSVTSSLILDSALLR